MVLDCSKIFVELVKRQACLFPHVPESWGYPKTEYRPQNPLDSNFTFPRQIVIWGKSPNGYARIVYTHLFCIGTNTDSNHNDGGINQQKMWMVDAVDSGRPDPMISNVPMINQPPCAKST